MNTPHEYLPVGKNTYDALDGAFASIGRSADREQAIEMAIERVLLDARSDDGIENEQQYINDRALELIARLDEIDRS